MSIRKFSSGIIFLSGLMILFTALLFFANALTSPRMESQLVEENKITLVMSLALSFGLGWLWSSLFEYIAKSNYRKTAVFILLVPVLISLIHQLTTRFTSSFWNFAIFACGAIFFSSLFLRLSVIHLDELAKLWERN